MKHFKKELENILNVTSISEAIIVINVLRCNKEYPPFITHTYD
jgi:hypothetical protein